MIRWVVKNDDQSLAVVCTGGHEPPNLLCKANDEWVAEELSYDGSIVFIDPEKIRAKVKIKQKEEFKIKIIRAKHWLESMSVKALGVATGFLLAYLAFRYWHL